MPKFFPPKCLIQLTFRLSDSYRVYLGNNALVEVVFLQQENWDFLMECTESPQQRLEVVASRKRLG